MHTIFKYPLELPSEEGASQTLLLPAEALILNVQVQNDIPVLWAEIQTDMPVRPRKICVYGTGWDLHSVKRGYRGYLGTVQIGPFVWHYFDETDCEY